MTNFDSLFEKYYPKLLFYATQFLDEAEAKDVVQDVFVELWKRRDTLVVGDKIHTYLYRLTYTKAINVLNHKKIESNYSKAVNELYNHKMKFYESESHNEIFQEIENRELEGEIGAAIDKLPDKCKEVFKLSYLYDLKNKEISNAMNISQRTVEAHIYKALKILRKELKHLFCFLFIYYF
ncbi:MAG: RNA polymerase sigma-70 factor [Candidatus Azobacteroides sp.]|nr:RNA polymerase sigma-70 factor [Candidatus Azobacteroides sp.]